MWGTAKTQKEARQNPSETDFPRFLLRQSTASVFFNARTLFLANPMPVATLLDSAGSSHRLTAPRYGLTSYCGRSLFTSDARSVMLRIPLPEDDGFALALLEDRGALPIMNDE